MNGMKKKVNSQTINTGMSNCSVWRTETNQILQRNEVAADQNQQLDFGQLAYKK